MIVVMCFGQNRKYYVTDLTVLYNISAEANVLKIRFSCPILQMLSHGLSTLRSRS